MDIYKQHTEGISKIHEHPFTDKPKKCSRVTKKYSDYGRYEFIQDYFPKVRLKLNCTKNLKQVSVFGNLSLTHDNFLKCTICGNDPG